MTRQHYKYYLSCVYLLHVIVCSSLHQLFIVYMQSSKNNTLLIPKESCIFLNFFQVMYQ